MDGITAYVRTALDLVDSHSSRTERLLKAADRTASALIEGGSYYLAGSETGWREEGLVRSGGLKCAVGLASPALARQGDAVWLSYIPENYAREAALAAELQSKGCAVVACGPKPANAAAFECLIDSLTGWESDTNLSRMGNVLSLWTLTAELASAVSRRGRTLSFWQNLWYPEGDVRGALYGHSVFHDGVPCMAPVPPQELAAAYLGYIREMFLRIRGGHDRIVGAGSELRRYVSEGRPVAFVCLSHLLPQLVETSGQRFQHFDWLIDRRTLERFLTPSGLLIYVGHNGVPPDIWRAVRRAGAKAIWIICPLPDQVDYEQFGDLVIDQGWTLGDCAVTVPGYDVRILPPSGLAQLFIYELLIRAADSPA